MTESCQALLHSTLPASRHGRPSSINHQQNSGAIHTLARQPSSAPQPTYQPSGKTSQNQTKTMVHKPTMYSQSFMSQGRDHKSHTVSGPGEGLVIREQPTTHSHHQAQPPPASIPVPPATSAYSQPPTYQQSGYQHQWISAAPTSASQLPAATTCCQSVLAAKYLHPIIHISTTSTACVLEQQPLPDTATTQL